MSILVQNLIDLIARYLHIVCTTLLVGGTLFYEMVVPVAIDELKQEQQLAVFARARWVFRRIVWISAFLLIFSGIISTTKHWGAYNQAELAAQPAAGATTQPDTDRLNPTSIAWKPGWWWAAHASTGAIAVLIALFLTSFKRPPSHPIGWMRLNLVILLIVIFLASATRHVRQVSTKPPDKPTTTQPSPATSPS
jgi:hypothetical protein